MKFLKLVLAAWLLVAALSLQAQQIPVKEAQGLGGLQPYMGIPAAEVKTAYAAMQKIEDTESALNYTNSNFKIYFALNGGNVRMVSYTPISKEEKAKFKADLEAQGYTQTIKDKKTPAYAKALGDGYIINIKGFPDGGFLMTKLYDESTRTAVPATVAATPAPAAAPAAVAPAASSSSGTQYGLLDYRNPINQARAQREPKNKPDLFKTYVFQSTCQQGSKTFTVISKISANLAAHNFDEVKQAALKMITNNGWAIQTDLKYLGTSDMVKLSGKAGKDYTVSENSISDF